MKKLIIIFLFCLLTNIGVAQTSAIDLFYNKIENDYLEYKKTLSFEPDSFVLFYNEEVVIEVWKISWEKRYKLLEGNCGYLFINDLFYDLKLSEDSLKTEEYIDFLIPFCMIISVDEAIRLKTEYYLDAISTGELLPIGNSIYVFQLEEIDSIPNEIADYFTDYDIFYQVHDVMGRERKVLSTIYEGELIHPAKILNLIQAENNSVSPEELIKMYFTLSVGFDKNFDIEINQPVIENTVYDIKSYEVKILKDSLQERFNVIFMKNQINEIKIVERDESKLRILYYYEDPLRKY